MEHFHDALAQLNSDQTLDRATTHAVMTDILEGRLDQEQISAFLTALANHHPTAEELTGAAMAMREQVTPVEYARTPGSVLLDTCGTGGAPKTFNVSTAAAIVLAGVEPPADSGVSRIQIAKHGNRSRTGRGSAEVLIELGVHVDASTEIQSRCLEDAGMCFCFAVNHHPAVRHAMPSRRVLGFPTIFNAIGPLTNPAGADCQLIGVYKDELVVPMAQTLLNLGTTRSMVVHSSDGLDELSTTAPVRVLHATNNQLGEETIDARDFGLERSTMEQLQARDAVHSAWIVRSIVDRESSPYADMALLTVAGGLIVAGVCESFEDGIELGRSAIESGRAKSALDTLVRVSNTKD